RLRMSSMRFKPEALWMSRRVLNSSSVSFALMMRVRLPVSMGGLPAFLLGLSMGVECGLWPLFWKKNQVAQVFPPLSEAPRKGCRRSKARWFSGYPKTQLAADKTKGDRCGVLAADRRLSTCGRGSGRGWKLRRVV